VVLPRSWSSLGSLGHVKQKPPDVAGVTNRLSPFALKVYMKKYLFTTFALLLITFFAIQPAFATDRSYILQNVHNWNVSLNGSYYVGQEFRINGTPLISGFKVSAAFGITTAAKSWTASLFAEDGTLLATKSVTNAIGAQGGSVMFNLAFDTPYQVTTAGQYFVGIKYNSGEGASLSMNTTDVYTNGCLRNYDGAGPITDNACQGSGAYDMRFDIQASDAPQISFDTRYLTNGTTTADFGYWNLVLGNVSSSKVVAITYWRTNSDIVATTTDALLVNVDSTYVRVGKSKDLADAYIYYPGDNDWTAYAEVWDPTTYFYPGGGTYQAITSQITFTIDAARPYFESEAFKQGLIYASSSAQLAAEAQGGCGTDTLFGVDILCSIQKGFYWLFSALFQPSEDGRGSGMLKIASDQFQQVFPFSLFYNLRSIVSAQVTSYSSAGTPLAMTVAFSAIPGGATPATSTITFANSTVLKDTVFQGSSTLLSWWYNLILIIVIVIFAYALYSAVVHTQE